MTKLPDGTLVENWAFHDVNLYLPDDGGKLVIHPEPEAPARLVTHRYRVSQFLCSVEFGEAINLPAERAGVYLIVSSPVKLGMPHRLDLITPNDLVRDTSGRVIGCRTFAMSRKDGANGQ
jgi:hypothetical protein